MSCCCCCFCKKKVVFLLCYSSQCWCPGQEQQVDITKINHYMKQLNYNCKIIEYVKNNFNCTHLCEKWRHWSFESDVVASYNVGCTVGNKIQTQHGCCIGRHAMRLKKSNRKILQNQMQKTLVKIWAMFFWRHCR